MSFRTADMLANGEQQCWDSTIVPIAGRGGNPETDCWSSRVIFPSSNVRFMRLDKSTRLKQALIEACSEMVWHVRPCARLHHAVGLFRIHGFADDPKDMDGWLNAVHAEDRERAKVVADAAGLSGVPVAIEYRLLHRAGDWRWVEDRAIPVRDDQGTVTDWVGIISDIHARTVAEQGLRKNVEYLRLAVEATGLGTWDVDMRTGARDWSPELFDLLGLPRDTKPDRSVFFRRIHPEDRARVWTELEERGGRDETPEVSVFRLAVADGRDRWVEAHERTFYDSDGNPRRRVGTLQDITERKEIEIEAWRSHTPMR